jgi:hypothetical protein
LIARVGNPQQPANLEACLRAAGDAAAARLASNPQAKATDKATAKAKAKAEVKAEGKWQPTGDLAGWGQVRVVKGSSQCYITGDVEGGWRLLISISKRDADSKALHHQDVIDLLQQIAIEPGVTKLDLLAERGRLLSCEA